MKLRCEQCRPVGFFSTTGDGIGSIVAAHSDGSPVTASSPAAGWRGDRPLRFRPGVLAVYVPEYSWPTAADGTSFRVQVDLAGVSGDGGLRWWRARISGRVSAQYRGAPRIDDVSRNDVRISQGYAQTKYQR